MLASVVCAMLQGARGYAALAQWVRSKETDLWHALGFTRKPPQQGAFRNLMMAVSPTHFERVLADWAKYSLGVSINDGEEKPLEAVAMDGKTLCGTLQPHAATARGRRASAGIAGPTHRLRAEPVARRRQDQRTQRSVGTLEDLGARRPRDHRRRNLLPARGLPGNRRLAEHGDWPHLAQVCRLVRKTRRSGVETTEIDYAITSVPRDQADAAKLLTWWRGHWGIENRSHYVRDVTLGEDASRIRKGDAPQNLAAMRNAITSMLRLEGHTSIAQAIRACTWKTQDMPAKLGIMKK